MKRSAWKKWGIGVLTAALLVLAGSLGWVDYQLRRFAGAFTETVDRSRFARSSERIAIVNVAVLSPDGSEMLPDRTVLVDDGKIVAVEPDGEVPGDAHLIDGSGRFLVPGLIDTHVHLRHSPNDLLLYLANGVTTIAEMSGNERHLEWRRETANGAPGPRMFVASEKLGTWGRFDGWFREWTLHRINVGSADNAGNVVNALADDGFDAVKIGTFLDRDTYLAVGEAARVADIPMIGHIPLSIGIDGLASPPSGIAHVEELVKALDGEFGWFGSRETDEFLAFVGERAPEIASLLRTHDVAVSTTLWLVESIPQQKFEPAALLEEAALEYANPGQVEGTPLSPGWLPHNNPYRIDPNASAEDREGIRRYWTTYAEAHRIVLRSLVDAGVRVMAGTDAGNAVVVPGFSLHDELRSLVDAGMSPDAALRTTAAAAEWMGAETGRIEAGRRADLVLLQANPLQDIDNTRRIEAVIVGGQLFDRDRLNEMLDAVKAANDASRSVPLTSTSGSAARR